jgi:hypothetical protein
MINEGDFVQWKSGTGIARGRVEHVMREGMLGTPDSVFAITATPEEPALLIRLFRKIPRTIGRGYRETNTFVGHRLRDVEKISKPTVVS